MPSPSASSTIESEVSRIRELSQNGLSSEALAAAESLVAAAPQDRVALYLVAANQRCLNRISEALATLQNLEQRHPRFSLLHQERGYCYMTLRDAPHAIEAFLRAVNLNPALVASWTSLERLLRMSGAASGADSAARQLSSLRNMPAKIVRAASLVADGFLDSAESILRAYLVEDRNYVEALQLLARIQEQRSVLNEAEELLSIAVKSAPASPPVRRDYVWVLLERQKYLRALHEANALLELEPDNEDDLRLLAAAHAGLGRHQEAITLYRRLLSESPESAELQMSLGHSLQSIGQPIEAIESYKAAAQARPEFGDAWWSLANLKTYRFSDDEIAIICAQEAALRTQLAAQPADRCHLCFALGKAHEDREEFAKSWQFYERGNALKRAESRYDPEIVEANTRRLIEVCTAQFFQVRAGAGAPHRDPIFIVGLPRSGSTLIEQILASHSQVEGTQELPDIPSIALDLQGLPWDPHNARYPGVLAKLAPEDFRNLGEQYMSDTLVYRGKKPFFLDKMPNNFRHIGLIHLILPNATIIDVRRDPMACCFSNLKQLFASGQEFSYSIEDIARYYRTYLDLMKHWDAALPGRVLRVCYEDLVADLEGNVRRILQYSGLEFEPCCVEFHKTERSVRTPSSEQVRRPIFREALVQWRNYEPWLGPLKDALGDAIVSYRE